MAQVGIDLVTSSDVAAEAEKAAKGFEKIVRQEELVQRVANQLGTKDIPAVTRAIAEQEKAMAKVAAQSKIQELAQVKAAKAAEAAEKKAKSERDKASKSAINAAKLQQTETLKTGKGIKSVLTGNIFEAGAAFGVTTAAVVGVTLAVAAATAATLVFLGAVTSAAVEAGKLRESSLAAMNVLTAGRGSQALELIDGLADQLGIKFQTARDRFVQFRQAGADNSTSAALLKLTADLDAIDPSGKLAEQAVQKTLGHKNKDGTLDIMAAKEEMALLAKQANVAGDGAASAAAKFTTVSGAMNSLDNSKTKFLEAIWQRIGPAVNSAAGAIAKFVDGFLQSERGQKVIEGISSAISFVANVIEASLPFVGAVIEGVVDGFDNIQKALSPIGDMLSGAFGGDKASTLDTIRSVVSAMTTVIGIATTVIGGLLAAGAAMTVVFTNPIALITALSSALGSMGSAALEAGGNIVSGVITGISNKAGELYARMSSLASQAWSSFKGALGISSPSKAMIESGGDMGEGVEIGFDQKAPDTGAIASRMIPEASALKAATSPAAAGVAASVLSPAATAATEALAGAGLGSTGSFAQASQAPSLQPLQGAAPPVAAVSAGGSQGGGPLIVIENLTATGGSAEENARSIRRELESMITAMQLARGQNG